jgi:hypothetical protein
VEELAERKDAPTMINGYPVFTWTKRSLEHLNIGDEESMEEDNEDIYFEDVEQQEHNDDQIELNEEALAAEQDNPYNYVTEEEDGYVTEETHHEETEEMEIDDDVTNIETGIEEDDIMNENNEPEHDTSNNQVSESSQGRPKRTNAGTGVERLELGHGTKEYASVKHKQFLTVKGYRAGARERGDRESFMSLATDVLFAQVGEFSQMTAKAGIKKFGEKAIAAMLQEFRQLNEGEVPGKLVFGTVNPMTLSREEKRRALEAVNLRKKEVQ